MDVLETAEDLVDEGLEVGVGQGLATADDGGQIALHQLFVQVDLVVAAGPAGNVHVKETCDLVMGQLVLDREKLFRRKDRHCGGLGSVAVA